MPEDGVRSGEGLSDNSPGFTTGIGSADGRLAVGMYDGAYKRRNKGPEQAQRQRMTDQIEQDKTPAEAAYISDEICEIILA